MITLLNVKCNYAPQLKIANAMNYEMQALVYETTMKNKPILYKKNALRASIETIRYS